MSNDCKHVAVARRELLYLPTTTFMETSPAHKHAFLVPTISLNVPVLKKEDLGAGTWVTWEMMSCAEPPGPSAICPMRTTVQGTPLRSAAAVRAASRCAAASPSRNAPSEKPPPPAAPVTMNLINKYQSILLINNNQYLCCSGPPITFFTTVFRSV